MRPVCAIILPLPPPSAELIYEWIMNGRVSLMVPSYGARRAKRGRNRKSAYSLRLREVRQARVTRLKLGSRSARSIASAWIY